jgi:hypothetical protein
MFRLRRRGVTTWTRDPCLEKEDQWAHTLDGADIDGERLFFTESAQPTYVCDNANEEALGHDLTRADDAKKKGKSHRTTGCTDDKDTCLCDAWLATSHDCVNVAH